jgi:hypothetical protein
MLKQEPYIPLLYSTRLQARAISIMRIVDIDVDTTDMVWMSPNVNTNLFIWCGVLVPQLGRSHHAEKEQRNDEAGRTLRGAC